MSEHINNRAHGTADPARQHHLKRLIGDLHAGRDADEVKREFAALFSGVSSEEIAAMEAQLVEEGMPIEEIQKLCDVHAAIMGTSVEDVHRPKDALDTPGHPLHQFELENQALETLIEDELKPALKEFSAQACEGCRYNLLEMLGRLSDVDKHYLRKENLAFPYLEAAGITAPPKVMWGVHDEIRMVLKRAKRALADNEPGAVGVVEEAAQKITEMIFKERNILFPMLAQTLTEDEWVKIAAESEDFGYCLVSPGEAWVPGRAPAAEETGVLHGSAINLGTGVLRAKQIELLLNHLPVDITFVDENDVVRYFSNGKERIFPRPKTIIGRQVQNCHPPKSMGVVEAILDDFKSGAKDHEHFWIQAGPAFIYIRYFAIRDEDGTYRGCLEVSENVAEIRALEGEKRILL